MVAPEILLAYSLIVLGFVFIPGPATMLTVARASTSGSRAGLATAIGIAVGDVMHTIFAVIGLSALVLASAFLFNLVKYLGAAYLVYLGLKAILSRPAPQAGDGGIRVTPGRAFREAVLAPVLNPKTATVLRGLPAAILGFRSWHGGRATGRLRRDNDLAWGFSVRLSLPWQRGASGIGCAPAAHS